MTDHPDVTRSAELLRMKAGLVATLIGEIGDLAGTISEASRTPASEDPVLDDRIGHLVAGLRKLNAERAKQIIDSVLRDIDITGTVDIARQAKVEMQSSGSKVNQTTLTDELRRRGVELGNYKAGVLWDAVKADPVPSLNGRRPLSALPL